MSELESCAQDIYQRGTCVALAVGEAHRVEAWVARLRMQSLQPIDWHYAGGRAIIKCLGDVEAVRVAVRALLPRFTGEHIQESAE